MYIEDANKTMQVINALRERQVFTLKGACTLIIEHTQCNRSYHPDLMHAAGKFWLCLL